MGGAGGYLLILDKVKYTLVEEDWNILTKPSPRGSLKPKAVYDIIGHSENCARKLWIQIIHASFF